MFFSEQFEISRELIVSYGAVDISLVCDVPLFVDPMLIFNSSKPEYQRLHAEIIRYFAFLYTKAQQGLTPKEVRAWFNFSEVPNNWLGYSLVGNKGSALGKKYADFLYKNIAFAVETRGISQSIHIEKIMLLYDGSGKDKISDLTVNLIKGYLCEYTEAFAKKHISLKHLEVFPVEKAFFSYETESFITKEYTLPFILNEKGKKEYVLLTPFDILREGEPAINKKHFYDSHTRIREAIDNEVLRAYVNNYISSAVKQHLDSQNRKRKGNLDKSIEKVEKEAFRNMVRDHPELYDYYIKLRENDPTTIQSEAQAEYQQQIKKLLINAEALVKLFERLNYVFPRKVTAKEEALHRLKFFKHIIEDCDGYKNLYYDGQPIANENDLQRLFRFVWCDTTFKLDAEPNNGRGQADFIVSMGSKDQKIIEFKLASNKTLEHVFTQVKIYEAANCTEGSIIAIFFFSQEEELRTRKIIETTGHKDAIGESIILIDCRSDNKLSASNPDAK